MSEHRPYKHPAAAEKPRAKEWVALEGGDVCVWALTVMEIMNLLEKASRPVIQGAPKEFSGGVDQNEELLWKIILSTFESDEPNAKLVWGGDQESMRQVFSLSLSEFTALAGAIQRVNGADPERIEALESFTRASEGANLSPSSLSVLESSGAALKR